MLNEKQNKILETLKANKDKGGEGMISNELASHLGIPLSDLEYYLKGIIHEGYIDSEIGSRTFMEPVMRYQITPSGTGYLLGKGDNE